MTRTGSLTAALAVLRAVARADPDRASLANAEGFSKSDVALGHRLATLHPWAFRNDPTLRQQALALAARYRRQASPSLAFESGGTDQPDLFA